ncbi:MAG: hypothetical protein D6686_16675 [Alphaproteobacteria bacterium]|nr:MAG: hypothetical protein D6686_16675 [Alphaproteobacteria bacterium]
MRGRPHAGWSPQGRVPRRCRADPASRAPGPCLRSAATMPHWPAIPPWCPRVRQAGAPAMLHDIALMQSPVRLRDMVRDWQAAGAEVALMPVLGPVHGGHLAMIRAARAAGLRVAACPVDVSDSCLPRDPERDAALLERAGADAVVAPDSGLHGAAGRLRLRPCWLPRCCAGGWSRAASTGRCGSRCGWSSAAGPIASCCRT